MDQAEFHVQLLRKLDLLIRLQLESPSTGEAPTTASMIVRLLDFGLTSTEVAAIVGKPTNYVTAVNAARKKKKTKKKRAR